MDETHTISISNLIFSWKKAQAPTLDIPDWQIPQGQRVFLYGRSGSGKSTLLNLISGILQSNSGYIKIDNTDIGKLSPRKRDQFRAENLGVIFQQFNLIPYLNVADNILLSQKFSKTPFEKSHLLKLVDQLGLNQSILTQKANSLSVGQQQRVAVIRALIHKPKLIIADEPTSALDTETRDEFIQLLIDKSNNQSTILFVSHDKSLAHHFDQVVDIDAINKAKR